MADTGQKALDVLSLMVLEDGKRWGETAAPFQWANARAILDMASDPRQHWIELPRGARKTTDLAGIQLAALYAQAPPMARLYVGASDEEQAQELIDAALGLIERTPELAGVFRTGELEITNAANGASVRALAADASAMGKRAWMITLDEVANWPETRKAKRFWGVLTSGNRKIADCRTVVITNAGDPQHWAWKRRETARTSRNWRFVSIPGPLPWLTPVDLAILQENAETESEYERLHLNRWTTSEDRLATRADLTACTMLPGPLAADARNPVRGHPGHRHRERPDGAHGDAHRSDARRAARRARPDRQMAGQPDRARRPRRGPGHAARADDGVLLRRGGARPASGRPDRRRRPGPGA